MNCVETCHITSFLCLPQDQMPLLTFILMGSLTLISMVMTCFIPETRNKVMAETAIEVEMAVVRSEQRDDSQVTEKSKDHNIKEDMDKGKEFDLVSKKFPSSSSGSSSKPNLETEKGVSTFVFAEDDVVSKL